MHHTFVQLCSRGIGLHERRTGRLGRNLDVVRVEAVGERELAQRGIVDVGGRPQVPIVLRLVGVGVAAPRVAHGAVAYLEVYVGIGLHIPYLAFRYGLVQQMLLDVVYRGGRERRAVGGGKLLAATLLYQELSTVSGLRVVALCILILHDVGDVLVVQVALLVLHVLRLIGRQAGQVRRGEVVAANAVLDLVVLVQARTLLGGSPEGVLLHHRTVIGTDGVILGVLLRIVGTAGQRLAHHFPAVLVEQDEHGVYLRLHEVEVALAHADRLEPVLYLLPALARCGWVGSVAAVPALGVGPTLIAVPA